VKATGKARRPAPDAAVVIEAHDIPARDPVLILPGETVTVGARDTEWPAFVFIEGRNGSGWVPARCLGRDRPIASVVERYDTRELATRAGEHLVVLSHDLEAGWTWCRNAAGAEGWVPQRTLRACT